MWKRFYKAIVVFSFTNIQAKEPELPLCPTNMQFFPQNLPMHCRMPPGSIPQAYQNVAGKQPQPIPMPIPGFPGGIAGGIQGAMPGGVPGGIPGPVPMPMPMMPMPPAPAQKLPVIVMPFYSQDTSGKEVPSPPRHPRRKKPRRRPKPFYSSDEDSTDTDTSTDDSSDRSSDSGWWEMSRGGRRSQHQRSKRRRYHKKPLLTPVLQYVTKDGYVIYEKQISKGEAQDWLGNKNAKRNEVDTARNNNENDQESSEPKNDVDNKFLMKQKQVEVTSEASRYPNHKKKGSKRKVAKKHDTNR